MTIDPIHERPVELLQTMIRFDTTNPPGDEEACMRWIAGLLEQQGVEVTLVGRKSSRPNLVARIRGSGQAPALMLNGHIDVVAADPKEWQVPPFEARIQDGCVWGRGALDMKGADAMMLAAFLRILVEGKTPPGDVVLCLVCDEEAGGDDGAKFLVAEHPELFKDIPYAITEGMGFSLPMGGKRLYPVQLAEKQICHVTLRVRGEGGHGSTPVSGGALARMGRVLQKLDGTPLPVHITPVARQMVETMAGVMPGPVGVMMRLMLVPVLTDRMLKGMGMRGKMFRPLFHNTATPTIVHGSDKVNVIPGEVTAQLDGRLLPGFTPDDLKRELAALLGPEVEVEFTRIDPGFQMSEPAFLPELQKILTGIDAQGVLWPFLLGGSTDARYFSQLGIQTYGFMPMKLDPNAKLGTVHGPDERIPVETVNFGAETFYRIMMRMQAA